MAVDLDKRYEFVTISSRYHNEKIIEVFQLFIKLTTAIVAGVVYITLSKLPSDKQVALSLAAIATEAAVSIVCVTIIISNLRSWWGFRVAESEIVGKDTTGNYMVNKPKFPRSCLSEIAMVAAIVLTFIGFIYVNPI